jgi:hypothetical protein
VSFFHVVVPTTVASKGLGAPSSNGKGSSSFGFPVFLFWQALQQLQLSSNSFAGVFGHRPRRMALMASVKVMGGAMISLLF